MSSWNGNHESRTPDKGFASFFHESFVNKQHTDIDFGLKYKNSESSFSGHKLILSIWSPYFADKFEREKRINIIELQDVNPKYFQAMLSFMYDNIPPMETPEEICGIYNVAKEFQVGSLMRMCHKKLNKIEILTSNIFDMLQAADFLQNIGTKNRCLNFFQENTKEVFAVNHDSSKISPSMMSFLLSSKKLSLDSLLDLFVHIFAWGKTRSINDHRFSTSREAIEEFLQHLPFASLKVEEFAKLCRHHQYIFYDNEVIQIFMNYAIPGGQIPYWYNKECQIEIKSSD